MFERKCLIKSDSQDFALKIKHILRSHKITYEEKVRIWRFAGQVSCYIIYVHKSDIAYAEKLVSELKRGLWIQNVRKLQAVN